MHQRSKDSPSSTYFTCQPTFPDGMCRTCSSRVQTTSAPVALVHVMRYYRKKDTAVDTHTHTHTRTHAHTQYTPAQTGLVLLLQLGSTGGISVSRPPADIRRDSPIIAEPKGEATNRDALSFRVCIYVCMYVCMYVYMYVYPSQSIRDTSIA